MYRQQGDHFSLLGLRSGLRLRKRDNGSNSYNYEKNQPTNKLATEDIRVILVEDTFAF